MKMLDMIMKNLELERPLLPPLSLMEKFCGKLTDNCTPQACEKLRMTACHLAERSKGLFQEGEAALAAEYLQTSGEILSLIGSFYL